ncbi:MAG: catechol 2,3-dioxygenase-like lactoylglutathione lyase family enzyme [Acidimicrobiales bacterium]
MYSSKGMFMTRTPSDPNQPPVFGLDHSAHRCRDAEETRAFYEDVVGFPLTLALHIDRHPTTGEPVDYLHIFFDIGSGDPDKPTHLAFFDVVDHPGDDPDELFKTRWGMDLHFAMRVADHADLDGWKQRLIGKGVAVEGPIDHGMFRSIYFHDPNGYRLEFTSAEEKEHQIFRDECAMARTQMDKWNAWKASRGDTPVDALTG